jgi:hypothetical protein
MYTTIQEYVTEIKRQQKALKFELEALLNTFHSYVNRRRIVSIQGQLKKLEKKTGITLTMGNQEV